MKTEVHDIGLEKANSFLQKNLPFDYENHNPDSNRPLSYKIINRYALEMLRGRWRLTHQGIAFDTEGALRDGQQRLLAIVQAATDGATDVDGSQVPPNPKLKVKMAVTFGLDPATFVVLDRGRGRTNDQILAMSGYTNTYVLASAARMLWLYDHVEDHKSWRRGSITAEDVLELVQKHNLNEYIATGYRFLTIKMIPSAAIAAYFICYRAFPEGPHEEFIEGVATGADLSIDDPRLALRNYLIRSTATAKDIRRRDATLHMFMYIKAWNDFNMGRMRSIMTFRNGEKAPRPVTSHAVNS